MMKKTLFFGLIVASLGFITACNKENPIQGEDTQTKGMVLHATVEQPAETRATIDNSDENWQFAFAEHDEIKVTNSELTSGTYYTFTSDGTNFKSIDAEAPATDANWFAYFPSNSIDLTGQAGTLASVANLFALAGTTESATTGESGLDITMRAKVAILKIENCKGAIDIQVKTSATNYVTGMTAKSGEANFDVNTSTTASSLLTTSSTGTYYVAVPAGVKMAVKDGENAVKSTGENGLTAGKYYTLTIGEPLTLTALENSSVKINSSHLQYKKSTQQDWADYELGSAIEVNNGECVQFRGKPGSTHTCVGNRFIMTGSFDVSGNVMSLLSGNEMGEEAFKSLFYNCTGLKNASQLQLPATTLTNKCYQQMFNGCTNLTTAPELPATTLADHCYEGMFQGCTNLTSAPAISAMVLAQYCCRSMFRGCSSLTTAPASLPAATLADYCYEFMFYDCTKLTTAPTISATTLAQYCCKAMFYGCSALTTAPALPATTLAKNCYDSMFFGCSNLTTAPTSLPATTLADYSYQNMFFNCSKLTAAPTISATTLAQYCCKSMFYGCSALTAAPALPATTLADNCYQMMFYNCTHLKSIRVRFTSWHSNATTNWVYNAGTSETAPKTFSCPSSLPDEKGNNRIPTGWGIEFLTM